MIGIEFAKGGLLRVCDCSIISAEWPPAVNKALMNLII